jgi:hypothetical protein
MMIDPTLIGSMVTVADNDDTQYLKISGQTAKIRGVSIEEDRRGSYALFLLQVTGGGFVVLEAGNCALVTP